MLTFVVALIISFTASLLIIRYQHIHARFSGDHDTRGIQKFHASSVPRIGGMALGCALLGVLLILWIGDSPAGESFSLLMISALPAFLGGVVEDLTKRIGVLVRLALTLSAAVLGFYLLDARLTHIDVAWIDPWMSWWPFGLAFTAIAVGGIANAVNIIDGYNGLSGAVSIFILAGLAYVGFKVGNGLVVTGSLSMIGALLGFLFWNWPWGKIFLGDGGAYLVGFWIAELSVLLVANSPAVSPWFPLLLVAYPLVETLFSIYRRLIVKGVSPGMPDAAHLHQLIFKRLVRWAFGAAEARDLRMRNSMTAPYLWVISSFSVIPAVLFWQTTWVLQLCILLFLVFYVWFYMKLVRFKMPGWLVMRGGGRRR
jgi:UDP-GlcNAc:undecaprenyl-phosphate GlcNAc-1-phosphate transferase